MLAAAHAQLGQTEAGLRVIAEANDLVARNNEHMWTAELRRVEGELRRVQGSPMTEVEAYFEQARSIAHDQSAKSFELRAACSLARLWRDQDRRNEAHHLLAEIYGRFSEGFDTSDLKDAKALLDELCE